MIKNTFEIRKILLLVIKFVAVVVAIIVVVSYLAVLKAYSTLSTQ